MVTKHLTNELLLALNNNPAAPQGCAQRLESPAGTCGPCQKNRPATPSAATFNSAKLCVVAMGEAEKVALLEALGVDSLVVDYFNTAGKAMKSVIRRPPRG